MVLRGTQTGTEIWTAGRDDAHGGVGHAHGCKPGHGHVHGHEHREVTKCKVYMSVSIDTTFDPIYFLLVNTFKSSQ